MLWEHQVPYRLLQSCRRPRNELNELKEVLRSSNESGFDIVLGVVGELA